MPSDTKQAIAAAFAQISQKKPVDKITVKDLVEHCGISRQTFYYHFQDILDVMEWSIRQLLQKAMDNGLHMPSEAEAIEEFIIVATTYGDVLLRLLNSQKREQVESFFVTAMSTCIQQFIIARKPDWKFSHADWTMVLRFYACGMTGVILDLCRKKDVDYKQLSVQLAELLSGNLI